MPGPPHWLVYSGGVATILALALAMQRHADAPEAPPPVPGEAQMPLAASSPFAAKVAPLPPKVETVSGTAFSAGSSGVWLTARHVIEGCRQPAIVVADGRGVAAKVKAVADDVAVLTTVGGSPALPIAVAPVLHTGQRAYLPGFPQGGPGEAASQLLGPQTLRKHARSAKPETDLAWAEVGRTDGLNGSLAGLSGAPALDSSGEVVGVTLAQAPRRGRIYTSTPQTLARALAAAGIKSAPGATGEPISVDNYGRVADGLRRALSVAQVVCLAT
jgi:S1-C subfamily serine protease